MKSDSSLKAGDLRLRWPWTIIASDIIPRIKFGSSFNACLALTSLSDAGRSSFPPCAGYLSRPTQNPEAPEVNKLACADADIRRGRLDPAPSPRDIVSQSMHGCLRAGRSAVSNHDVIAISDSPCFVQRFGQSFPLIDFNITKEN